MRRRDTLPLTFKVIIVLGAVLSFVGCGYEPLSEVGEEGESFCRAKNLQFELLIADQGMLTFDLNDACRWDLYGSNGGLEHLVLMKSGETSAARQVTNHVGGVRPVNHVFTIKVIVADIGKNTSSTVIETFRIP